METNFTVQYHLFSKIFRILTTDYQGIWKEYACGYEELTDGIGIRK